MSRLMFIDNEWVKSSDDKYLNVFDPSTGKVLDTVPHASKNDTRKAVDAARDAFDRGVWSRLPVGERANLLLKVASMLDQESKEFIRLEASNSGKALKQVTYYDWLGVIDSIRFLAGASRVMEGKAMAEYAAEGTSAIRREPVGVVACITPWNYPLMLGIQRAIPALAMGNTVVVKPPSYTPLTLIEFARVLQQAGLPKGVLNVVTGPGSEVGEELATHPSVDMISFTGSTEVGRRLMELGSRTVKKISLELGGKAPFIVFGDADIEAAVRGGVVGGLLNNAQECGAATRFYIHKSIFDRYVKRLVEELDKVRIGPSLDMKTDLGPLVSETQRKTVEGYIAKGVEEGGRILRGGKRPKITGYEGGYYVEPTVIQTENHDSAIVMEEIFGPVLAMLKFDTYEEVIEKSNRVIYGLTSSVWTKDVTTAMRATRDLRAGTVWVNEHFSTMPVEMPWGGCKQSGTGVEASTYSLEECTNIKHVYFDISGTQRRSWHFAVYGERS
jgi:betaine-aldehyde dehydrogenase